jgi:hypothetical protein
MYTIKNTEKGTIKSGGRKSNMGKIVNMRGFGSATVVVERLGQTERVYNNKRVCNMLKGR